MESVMYSLLNLTIITIEISTLIMILLLFATVAKIIVKAIREPEKEDDDE